MSNMSHDRVKFFLGDRYFTRNNRDETIEVLAKSLDSSVPRIEKLLDKHPCGLWIVCRPSQFARFIINRANSERGVNGIRDLKANIFLPSKELGGYAKLAQAADVEINDIVNIVNLLHISENEVEKALDPSRPYTDFSMNEHGYDHE